MKIIVADRETVERGLAVKSRYAVISIVDVAAPEARIPRTSGCCAVLRLRFDDAEPTPGFRLPPGVKPMQLEDAEQIAAFIKAHRPQVGAFVVHCEQGASRSPAVAAAIAEYVGDDPLVYFQRYVPNEFVFRMLRECLKRDVAGGSHGALDPDP